MNWYLKCFKQYADFKGRARRTEFWMFILFNFLILSSIILLEILCVKSGNKSIYRILSALYGTYSIAILLPGLAVSVRRLHDIGKSGSYILLYFIPILGAIYLLYLFAKEGESGANQYGEDPKKVVE